MKSRAAHHDIAGRSPGRELVDIRGLYTIVSALHEHPFHRPHSRPYRFVPDVAAKRVWLSRASAKAAGAFFIKGASARHGPRDYFRHDPARRRAIAGRNDVSVGTASDRADACRCEG